MTFNDLLLKNVELRDRYNDKFFRIFGIRLSKFWNNLTGFDVIEFDDWLKPNEDESTAEALLRLYGEEGRNIVQDLLGIKNSS